MTIVISNIDPDRYEAIGIYACYFAAAGGVNFTTLFFIGSIVFK
jgi:hypothetical protein